MKRFLLVDFDNTMMATEKLALPSLIARFNELYAAEIDHCLTLEEFKNHFHGQARESLCKSLSEHFCTSVDYAVLFKDREWLMQEHYQKTGVEMAPNMIESLKEFQAAGFGLAVVTNNPLQRAFAALRCAENKKGAELASLFGANFFESGDVQKPKPDVYLRTMKQLGTEPKACVAVEDSVTGVKSARAAGVVVFGFTGFADDKASLGKKLAAEGAVVIFDDWAALPGLVKDFRSS